jgi:hypothetical protein
MVENGDLMMKNGYFTINPEKVKSGWWMEDNGDLLVINGWLMGHNKYLSVL